MTNADDRIMRLAMRDPIVFRHLQMRAIHGGDYVSMLENLVVDLAEAKASLMDAAVAAALREPKPVALPTFMGTPRYPRST